MVTVRFSLTVILENGVIRTLDPRCRRRARSRSPVSGSPAASATHETALASPETVDLGGRCVLPGFTDSHVHFVAWALAQHEVRFEGTRTLEEAVERVRPRWAGPARPAWMRGTGLAERRWSPSIEPTRQVLDAVTGDAPDSAHRAATGTRSG